MARESAALRRHPSPEPLSVSAAHLSVRSLTCRPAARGCLKDVSLDVERGELLALVGPAGSGKSLLLRVLAGLEQPDSGSVYLDADDVTDTPPGRRGVSMVFPSAALPPHQSLRHILCPPTSVLPWRVRRDELALRAQLGTLAPDLLPHLGAKFGRLLPILQAQASVANAVLHRPRLLLLDDPLARVDQPERNHLARRLKHLVASLGLTAIYATLDQSEGLAIGHRVAVLNAGMLEQVGTPHGLETMPHNLFVATWVHYAGLNLFTLRLEPGGTDGPRFVGPGIAMPVASFWAERLRGRSQVVVAVRPEKMRLSEHESEALYRASVRAVETLIWERRKRLHLAGPAGEQVAVVGLDFPARQGLPMGVSFDLADALLFDAASGGAL